MAAMYLRDRLGPESDGLGWLQPCGKSTGRVIPLSDW